MEDAEQESLDGSSIKPVSSLRSHFEQMAMSKPSNNGAGPRTVSPGPGPRAENGIPAAEGLVHARGRERETTNNTDLVPPRISSNASRSPSPMTRLKPIPQNSRTVPPVNVFPPQSPPKAKALNLTMAHPSVFLSTEASPRSASSTPSSASPRHFRIPSRPNTPLLEPRKSPSLSGSQPPSPPPPRRSGEMRRESLWKAPPPPINRAEKPKIKSKPLSLTPHNELTGLAPKSSTPSSDHISPFNTPPSGGSSPEREPSAPALPPNRPALIPKLSAFTAQTTFEPPPTHHSVIARRKDSDSHGLGQSMTPQMTGEQRPILPNRNPVPTEPSKQRSTPASTIPPPPTRAPADKSRMAVSTPGTTDSSISFATPPKRVFSSPTSQLQTPPRSHGRSMTVDRTSDRVPIEFREPIAPIFTTASRATAEVGATSLAQVSAKKDASEYPDPSYTNRRAPFFKQGPREIPTKYDTRLVDVCGEYVCTSGLLTRVWNLLDGELVMSLAHTEGIKIMSIAFRAGSEADDEGSRLWLGNNVGELLEVDIASQSIVASKPSAHTRREIIKMYRHLNEMWTLDDGGTLHLWGPDNTGVPNLNNPTQSFRLPKGHTFSMVVGDELWHAAGKEIRIFMPTLDGSTQFQVLQRPLSQGGAGDVTSGAVISSQSDRIYFGHVDGKISIYSRQDYSCLGVINISVYKITSLAGVGNNIWASFSTGMVYVYDTLHIPWLVKKDWHAHHDPVISLVFDRSSFWKLDRAQVVSLGQDNMVKVWDGFLQEDWIENEMQSQEADFCELTPIKTLVMTWNAGASTPSHLRNSSQDASFFRDLFQSSNSPDILVFGFQELVDLEDKKTTAKSFFKSKKKDPSDQEHMSHQYRNWRDFLIRSLDDYMPRDDLYHLLHTASMVGLFTCIFVKAPLRERIHSISGAEVKRGMGGLHGNKGALILRFILDDTSMCFVNCHLAAGQTQTKDRNTDVTQILDSAILPVERDASVRQDSFIGGGDGSMIMDHELCILNGDLNYRIDTMGRDTVVNAIKANNLSKLLERDQLLASKRKNPWFKLRAFHELPITFAPTYKYDVGTDEYDTSEKKRAPAWCDRILYRGRNRIKQLDYQRWELRTSDHRPVTGLFEMTIKTISPKRRAMKWDECQKRLAEMMDKVSAEAKLDYLTNILQYDPESCRKMLLEGNT
ncbi:hypothetical protein BP5796_00896 [Coleophoma crateriformis]|uniref:Inositol polyphosphate-related phosphatase domain-containing protein n=1 Tax=Coleophoma crateriformis TaxID=565419 RepID=A0A3D8T995_9HELO|nr:hypothetical protein BP5796_00896 [Coleophoma crateriformis]